MAIYLRDQFIQNISIDADALTQISNVFTDRFTRLSLELKDETPQGNPPSISFIIRFDNKGYRVFSLDELLNYFNQAKVVERISFTIESDAANLSNRRIGAFLELCLDTKDTSRCFLVSSSDNKDWAEASFAAVHEMVTKHRTKTGLARSQWANLAVQICGVVVIFVASLWLSFKIAPNLRIENPFVISFLFTLLVFSNIWGYLNQTILRFIAKVFPNIEFIRPAKAQLHWILQTFIGTGAFTIVLYLLGEASSFVTKFLSNLF